MHTPGFSSRIAWDSRPNPLTKLLNEKRSAGARVLDLTESNPTRAEFAYPQDQILAALASPEALRYDPDPRGLASAREAVSQYYAERGAAVDPARIILTASTSEAYAYVFKLLCDPGDEVLVPRPSYPLFDYLAAMESVRVKQYPLRYDGGWHIDLPALAAAVSPSTKALAIVNPNNPTGSFLKREEWARIKELGVPVISDEVFADFTFAPDGSRVATLADSRSVLTFTVSGLSKIAGLPQMKLGWIVAGGPRYEAALDGLEWIADTFLSVGTAVQLALPELLNAGNMVRAQVLERTRTNLALLRNAAGPSSPARVLNVEGGWYATLQVPSTRTEEQWALDLLAADDVLIQPGFFYDFESEAFLVLSLLTPPDVFQNGIHRILARIG